MGFEEKKLKVLETLDLLSEDDIWDLAGPLLVFIRNSTDINEELLDAILGIVSKAISETKDKVKLEKLKKAKSTLEWMLKEELAEKNKENKEADNMLDSVDF